MGRWHAAAISRSRHIVGAIVDPDAGRAAALASAYPGSQVASTLADVSAIDVVHVCTPLETHVLLTREALERGHHAIVEKPLAATAAETKILIDLAAAAQRLIVPVHQFLFQRGVRRALKVLPTIAPLLHVDVVVCTAGASRLGPSGREQVVLEILPHPLSLAARLVSPAIVDAQWHVRNTAPGELRVDGVVEGTTVSALISAGGRPTINAMRLIGESGTIHIDLFHGFASITRGRTTRAGKIVQPFIGSGSILAAAAGNLARRAITRESAYPGLRDLVDAVYASAATGGAPPISSDECLAVAAAIDQIRALSKTGDSAESRT
jgi:predicted dehydrogenase